MLKNQVDLMFFFLFSKKRREELNLNRLPFPPRNDSLPLDISEEVVPPMTSFFRARSALVILLVLLFAFTGCVARGYTLRYEIDYQEPIASTARVGVEPFEDLRPENERDSFFAGFGANASSDKMFGEPVAATATNQMLSELNARGLTAVRAFDGTPDYLLNGEILHFQVVEKNPLILPYLDDIVLFWANRNYGINAEFVVSLRDTEGRVLIDQKHYTISEDVEQDRGFLDVEQTFRGESGIAEYCRGTLHNVLYQISLDTRTYVVNAEATR